MTIFLTVLVTATRSVFSPSVSRVGFGFSVPQRDAEALDTCNATTVSSGSLHEKTLAREDQQISARVDEHGDEKPMLRNLWLDYTVTKLAAAIMSFARTSST